MSILRRGLFARPALPVVSMLALAFAATGLQISGTDWTLVGAAAAVALALIALAALVPWPRLRMSALLVLPVGADLVIALLRQAQGGSTSGYGPLVLLPVLFVGLLMRRRHVAVMTAATVALFALPIMIAGAPAYPQSGWRGVVRHVAAVSAIAGLGVNRVIAAQRGLTELADQRARELDRVVAVQTAIATSRFDLDSVMNTVVEEAQQLDGRRRGGHRDPRRGRARLPRGGRCGGRAPRAASRARDRALGHRSWLAPDPRSAADSDADPRVDREASEACVGAPLGGCRAAASRPRGRGRAEGLQRRARCLRARPRPQALAVLAGMWSGPLLSRRRVARATSSELADTDALTGLANRRSYTTRSRSATARSRRHGPRGQRPVARPRAVQGGPRPFRTLRRRPDAAHDREPHWSAALCATPTCWAASAAMSLPRSWSTPTRRRRAEIVGRLRGALPAGERFSAGSATWDGEESCRRTRRARGLRHVRGQALAASQPVKGEIPPAGRGCRACPEATFTALGLLRAEDRPGEGRGVRSRRWRAPRWWRSPASLAMLAGALAAAPAIAPAPRTSTASPTRTSACGAATTRTPR